MNGHFFPPPPGVVFMPHGPNYYSPANFVPPQPSQHAQFSPLHPSTSQNGAYPLYPYPPPYMNPLAVPFSPSRPPPYMPHFPPPGLHHVNQNHSGYVYPNPQHPQQPIALNGIHNHSGFPEHPPGLPIPHRNFPVLPGPDPISRDHIEINEYWKGRLAPLPGYRSQPVLLPMKDPRIQEEAKPDEKPEKKLELLPPVSFFGKNYIEPPSLTQTLEELKNDKKLEVCWMFLNAEQLIDFEHRKLIKAFKWTNTYINLPSLVFLDAEHDVR